MPSDRRADKKRVRVKDATILYEEATLLRFLKTKTETPTKEYPLVNLSGGGAQFVTREAIAPKQALVLTLKIPAFTKALEIKSEVTWCKKMPDRNVYQVGVRFTGKRPKEVDRLLKEENLRFQDRSQYLQ